MADRYWVGASGSLWDATNTAHWSATSGGPSGASAPTLSDNAIFDTNSGAVNIVVATNTAVALNLQCTNSQPILFTRLPIVADSFILNSSITVNTSTVTYSTAVTNTLYQNNATLRVSVTINNAAAVFNLGGNFTSTGGVTLTTGTFNSNNYNAQVSFFRANTTLTRVVNFGSSTVTITGESTGVDFTLGASTVGLTANTVDSTIVVTRSTSTTGTTCFLEFTSQSYKELRIAGLGPSTTQFSLFGPDPTFATLSSTGIVQPYTIAFVQLITFNIGLWNISGVSGASVTVTSNFGGLANLNVLSTGPNVNYLDITNISSVNTQPVTFYAGPNSLIRGTASGFVLTSYVSGRFIHLLTGSGNWTVPDNWNAANNIIHLFGGGGGGSGSVVDTVGLTCTAGSGGGGGGWNYFTNQNLLPRGIRAYSAGLGGTAGIGNTTNAISFAGNGGDTTFLGRIVRGGRGASTKPLEGVPGLGGSGEVGGRTGGTGGLGLTTATTFSLGNGGGAGAGGPNGNGGNGGAGTSVGGGGGGGNGGGTAGGLCTVSNIAGVGGNNSFGVGGGSYNGSTRVTVLPFDGGGGSGPGGLGSSGVDTGFGVGGGGGGGTGGGLAVGAAGGGYGGGGSGGCSLSQTPAGFGNGAAGAPGGIIIVYYAPISNFFFLF